MDLFGWQIDTWYEWGCIVISMIILDGFALAVFGTLIFTRILIMVLTKGKSDFKGGGGRSGGGGSNGSF